MTLMFTDVESSTEMTSRIGDEGWRDVLRKHHEKIRAIAQQHGGQEIKSLGDGLMLAFVSARRAVQAAVAIQQAMSAATAHGQPFRIRIGLNTGEVAHEEGDLLGTAVNAAARIAAKAGGGQIYAAEVVKQLVGTIPGVGFTDRGRMTLRGLPERWRLFEVTSSTSGKHSNRTPFIGRDEERALIQDMLERALIGNGGVVMLGGEPGIGKTRLAEEVGQIARSHGALTLIGRCQDAQSPMPYGPWVEMTNTIARLAPKDALRAALGEDASEVARLAPELRRLYPDLPEPIRLPPEQERHFLFNSIVNYLERSSRIQPLVLVMDDIQWADEASLQLLTQVAQRAGDMATLVICTYRDIELEVGRPLARTLEDLLRRRLAKRISLDRFSSEGVERLLTGLARRLTGDNVAEAPPAALLKVIFRETEGNPFFVEEVFQHLSEEGRLLTPDGGWATELEVDDFEVPESIRLVIGRRLERLSDPTRKILTTAAVLGPRFSYELLEQVEAEDADAVVDAIDEAESAHLISSSRQGQGVQVAFAHELIRQTLISSVSIPRRQKLHLKIAETMEQVYSESGRLIENSLEIAHHLYESGGSADIGKTVRYLVLAGDISLGAAAIDEARERYEQALELHRGQDPTTADLLFKIGYTQRALGWWDKALDNWNRSLSIYEGLKDETGARLSRAISYQLAWAGRTQEARDIAVRGLDLIHTSQRERSRLLAAAGMATGLLGDPAGFDMLGEAERMTGVIQDERTKSEVDAAAAIVDWAFARPKLCYEKARPVAERMRQKGDLYQWVGISVFIEQCLTMMGRFEDADRFAAEYVPSAHKIGHLGALIPHRRSAAFRMTRDSPEMLEAAVLEDEAEIARFGSAWVGQARAWKAGALYYQGRWEEAVELAIGPAMIEAGGVYEYMNLAGLALFLTFMGRADVPTSAMARIELPGSPAVPVPSGRRLLIMAMSEVYALSGERTRAAELLPFIEAGLEEKLLFGFFNPRTHLFPASAAAAAAGDWDRAQRYFDEGIDLSQRLSLGLQVPLARYVWSKVLSTWGTGRQEQARTEAYKAVEGCERLGMKRQAEIFAAELA